MVLEALKVEIREGRTNLARLADVYRKLSEEENLRRYLDPVAVPSNSRVSWASG